MNIVKNEIRTGILVVLTLAALVSLLLYLGSPGVFVAQKTFRIFFDNSAGLEPGAPVLLAGRRVGEVRNIFSPVPEKDRPSPKMETIVEVQVDESAQIFSKVKAQMTQPSVLGKPVIDFTTGLEASGLAPDGTTFIGERPGGLADAVPALLEKLDPMLKKATTAMDSFQKTTDNLSRITAEGSDLPKAMAEFKKLGVHLNELTGPDSSIRKSFDNVKAMTGEQGKLAKTLDQLADITGPGSNLTKTLTNAEKFTAGLADNKDIPVTLKNFRRTSENLDGQISRLSNKLSSIADNLEEASDTVKRQPWRLIWPSTKKYEEPGRPAPPSPPRSSSKTKKR